MTYLITPMVGLVRKEYTTKQRRSSRFTETPVIGGHVLRRGTKRIFTERQMKLNSVVLKRLSDAEAIKITPIQPKVLVQPIIKLQEIPVTEVIVQPIIKLQEIPVTIAEPEEEVLLDQKKKKKRE